MSKRITIEELQSYLWNSAVLLRTNIDAGAYKQYIFPLLFFKRICDVYDEETSNAVEEYGDDASEFDEDEIHTFIVPKGYHWNDVRAVSENVGVAIVEAFRKVENANSDKLQGIFGDGAWTNKNRLPDRLLKDLLEHFSTKTLSIANCPEDELGQGYEYLIKKFADDSGHTAQEFYTNRTVVHLMTEMLKPESGESMDIWQDALETFFCGDNELIDYVQEIAGLSAIGKVCVEGLIIAYGEGRNGKSTFWNTLSRVMGTYSGNMSADTLTVGCKRNVKPELAEAKGKRIIIAAELEEGMRLNTSNVKQLCSTDEIYAEKKYKDPFSFVPSHTLVLYTNHLPKVGAIDAGTWRRLIVIPFNAKIEGSSDIKNYADYLFNKAGGAILKWIMTGAKRVIEKDYHIVKPAVVEAAIQKYKNNNDWLSQFLDECCEIDSSYSAKSGDVYNAYRSYCMQVGDYIRSTTDFYTALECAGFERKRSKSARLLFGLQLKSDFLD